jgi:hypothetical protein
LGKSPYGIKHNLKEFDGLISHLKRRRDIELRIIDNIIGKEALIIDSKNYDINEIIAWCKH